jgi:hypothetical protein
MLSSDHTYIPRELFKVKMDNAEWANAYYYGYKDFDTGIIKISVYVFFIFINL